MPWTVPCDVDNSCPPPGEPLLAVVVVTAAVVTAAVVAAAVVTAVVVTAAVVTAVVVTAVVVTEVTATVAQEVAPAINRHIPPINFDRQGKYIREPRNVHKHL